jgi:DNA replication and repair protein RecF
VHVRRLQISNFRNYGGIDLELPAGNLVFLGDNAQGKSNLLEAVHLLATARSLRASSDAELIGWQAEAEPQPVARVAAAVERKAGPVGLEAIIVGTAPGAGREVTRAGKRLRVNGIARRAADMVGLMRSVLFTAEDLAIISGSPSERRHFLDSMLSQLDKRYYAASQRYARILQQRNAALKRIREGLATVDELPFWDESLLKEGAFIVDARLAACARLAPVAAEYHHSLSGEAQEQLEIEYCPRLGEDESASFAGLSTHDAVAAALGDGLQAVRRREIAAGMCLVGPHRDDLIFRINGASAASFGSRAQVRTATLALRLAEARLLQSDIDDPPLLLLDDIVSELDEGRRKSVLRSIADFDQAWFTATDTHGFDSGFLAAAHVYRIEAGAITPADP